MAKKITPVKPPTKKQASTAMSALKKGKTTKAGAQTLGGRIGAEAAAVKKAPRR